MINVQEIEYGRYEWRDFSSDWITKGGKVFCVYSFNDFLHDGLFDQ